VGQRRSSTGLVRNPDPSGPRFWANRLGTDTTPVAPPPLDPPPALGPPHGEHPSRFWIGGSETLREDPEDHPSAKRRRTELNENEHENSVEAIQARARLLTAELDHTIVDIDDILKKRR
jgi:hypothetical protein